jgi:hypothetical protein
MPGFEPLTPACPLASSSINKLPASTSSGTDVLPEIATDQNSASGQEQSDRNDSNEDASTGHTHQVSESIHAEGGEGKFGANDALLAGAHEKSAEDAEEEGGGFLYGDIHCYVFLRLYQKLYERLLMVSP